MKEIDINIEGFNVNGICVGCLNYKRLMFYDEEVKNCFKLLANIDVSTLNYYFYFISAASLIVLGSIYCVFAFILCFNWYQINM